MPCWVYGKSMMGPSYVYDGYIFGSRLGPRFLHDRFIVLPSRVHRASGAAPIWRAQGASMESPP